MILLTGASGFIGSHLLKALIKEFGSDKILALTSKPVNNCRFLLHNNYAFNKTLFTDAGFSEINTIIHAGAFTPKSFKQGNIIERSNSNIVNTNTLLSSHFKNIKKFIFLSTLDIYGNEKVITEKSIVNPISLYGNSKFYCEKLIATWAKQNKIQHQILRIGHVYGPGEEEYQKIIPNTMQKILNGEMVQLFGEGKDIRSFIYISDVIRAIIKSIKLKPDVGEINLVGHEQISIKELLDKIAAISNHTIKIKKRKTLVQPRNIIFDNKKMKNLLCAPKIELNEGLRLEWNYMKNLLK